jgi:hypothetical protein
MQETPQQYTERILGYLQGSAPLDVLSTTPRKVAALIKGVPKKTLSKRPKPGGWSVIEILAHLADVELVQGFRIRLILGSSGITIQGFDQDVWARYSEYAKHDPALSMEAWKANRERTLRLLKGLPRDMWDSYGMHSERGKETVSRVAEMMAGHDINHLKAIRKILKGE